MAELSQLRIAILAAEGVEELTLTEPLRVLQEQGAMVEVLVPREADSVQTYVGERLGVRIPVTRTLAHELARPDLYDALVLPGGMIGVDLLRRQPAALEFIRQMQLAEKPIVACAEAVWILASSGLVRGRRVTGSSSASEEVRNAGGVWLDSDRVADGNWLTCQTVQDMPALMAAMLALFRSTAPLIQDASRGAAFRSRFI